MRILRSANLMIAGVAVLVAVSVLVSASYAKIDPENIVGMWLFDEGKGETVEDSTGNGHDGTITGPPGWGEGKFGEALNFEAGNYVRVPHSEDLSLKTFTVTAWLSTEVGGEHIGVISKAHDNATRNYTLFLHSSSVAAISIGNEAAGTWSDKKGATPVNDGEWHHVAISFDEKSKVGRVFTDGVQEGEYTVEHDVPQNNADLVFAAWHHTGDPGYIGMLDEIAIFDVALEEEDIQTIMNEGLGVATSMNAVEPLGKVTTTWGIIKSQD